MVVEHRALFRNNWKNTENKQTVAHVVNCNGRAFRAVSAVVLVRELVRQAATANRTVVTISSFVWIPSLRSVAAAR